MAAALVLVTATALAEPPPPAFPPGVERVGTVPWIRSGSGEWLGGVVYVKQERLGKKSTRSVTFLELHHGAAVVGKIRMPLDFSRAYTYALAVEHVSGDHQVVVFDAVPKGDDPVSDRDLFRAFLAMRKGAAGPLEVIWSGVLDGVDPRHLIELSDYDGDGEREVLLASLDRRILFCGQGLAAVLPRVWDFKKNNFVAVPYQPGLSRDAPMLQATATLDAPITSHFPDLVSFRSASSDLRDLKARPGSRVSLAVDLADGSPSTAWVEGVEGFGIGEFVTADVNRAYPLRGLRIIPGHGRDKTTWDTYAAPREVLLTFSNGSAYRVELPQLSLAVLREKGGLYVALPEPVDSECVSLTILSVYPPAIKPRRRRTDDGQRTAVSELTPLNALDFEPRQEAIRLLVNDIVLENKGRRQRALIGLAEGLGSELRPAVLDALRDELGKPKEVGHPDHLVPLIVRLPAQDGVAATVEYLAYPKLTDNDVTALQRAISFEARSFVEPLMTFALDPQTNAVARERIVHILGRAAEPDQLKQFVGLLGEGSTQLRKDVIRGLSRVPIESADPILARVADNPGQPAAHDGLWALDRITRKAFRGELGTLPGAERIFQAYVATDDLQIRIRALRLLARVTENNGDSFLVTVLESKERPELRAMAASALANYSSDKATNALLHALGDESPTVRIAAVQALAGRASLPVATEAVTDYARKEDWGNGLSSAYRVLALSKQRSGPDYLYQIVEGADDRRAALAVKAVDKARDNVRVIPLGRVIADDNRPVSLRVEAIGVLAWTRDAESEQLLVDLVNNDGKPIELRRAAVRVFQFRQTPAGFAALANLLASTDEMKLQIAIVRVLAYYRGPKTEAVLREARPRVVPRVQRYIDESLKIFKSRKDFEGLRKRAPK